MMNRVGKVYSLSCIVLVVLLFINMESATYAMDPGLRKIAQAIYWCRLLIG